MDLLERLARYVAVPAPPGEEEALRELVAADLREAGVATSRDEKGNLWTGDPADTRVLVTAHLDEIALLTTAVRGDGLLSVTRLGGMRAFKEGERPVLVLGSYRTVPGILGYGSVHTEDLSSAAASDAAIGFDRAGVFTGLTLDELESAGIGPGTRIVVDAADRRLVRLGPYVASRFLDDRALLAIGVEMAIRGLAPGVGFAATVSEEVGGEGALWLLRTHRIPAVVALEIGPDVPDAPTTLGGGPTVWVKDGYAAMRAEDLTLVRGLGIPVQFQALSRGGSDATLAAAVGFCARPFTVGLPVQNSHGWEIAHPDDLERVLQLTSKLADSLR